MSPDTGLRADPEYRYAARTLNTTYETRHEAVGDLARFGDWENDRVVPSTENCLVRQMGTIFVGPEHLGDKYFRDRQHIATTHGVAQIDQVSMVRHVNGTEQEAVESWWEIECPVCGYTHEVDGASEDARRDAIDEMLDCCDIEWQPPSDWVEDCDICGDSHREQHECTRLSMREPFPSPDSHHYDCAECDWSGDGDELDGPDGLCPECGTASVRAIEIVTDGGEVRDPEDQQSGPNYGLEIDADELLADLVDDAARYGKEYEEKRQWWVGSFDDSRQWLDAKNWMLEARGGQRAYSEALAKLQPGGRYRNDDGTVDVSGFMRFLSAAAQDCHERSSGPYPDTRQADEGEAAFTAIQSTLRDDYGIGWPRLDDLGGNPLECDLP